MDQNRLALLALHFIPGVGAYSIRQLVSYCGSAEQVFNTPKGKLMKIPGIGPALASALQQKKTFDLAEKEIRLAELKNASLLFYLDKKFPSRLKQIPDSPTLLYSQGKIDFENAKCVAIVGTRNATHYGKELVEELVSALTGHHPLIISGLAYGIDIAAHKAAEKNGLPTVAVMGSGLDYIYPNSHKDIAQRIQSNGGLVTEHGFGTKPDAHNFPARNRIIAGCCDALVVVEAAEKGGALISAEIANSYNRDVFAYPGNVGQTYSIGCNKLIKSNRAHLMTSAKDIEYIMNWTLGSTPPVSKKTIDMGSFDENERSVVQVLLEKSNMLVDELSWRSQVPVGMLASVLLTLEFKGVVQSLPGKAYRLAKH